MKNWMYLLTAAAAIVLPRLGTPAEALETLTPVTAVQVLADETGTEIRTDAGASGRGETLADAVADLHRSSPERLYLDTADYVLLWGPQLPTPEELTAQFRPACRICRADPQTDLKQAVRYLRTHPPDRSLRELQAGMEETQQLRLEGKKGAYVRFEDHRASEAGVAADSHAGAAGPCIGGRLGRCGGGGRGDSSGTVPAG